MAASNARANQLLFLAFLVAVYFGWTFVPPWIDNFNLKQAAREWISSSRQEQFEEKGKRRFMNEAKSMGINLREDSCKFERNPDGQGAKVICDYLRDAEFLFINKKRTQRWRWVLNFKYR